jgi:hypothetical protein
MIGYKPFTKGYPKIGKLFMFGYYNNSNKWIDESRLMHKGQILDLRINLEVTIQITTNKEGNVYVDTDDNWDILSDHLLDGTYYWKYYDEPTKLDI